MNSDRCHCSSHHALRPHQREVEGEGRGILWLRFVEFTGLIRGASIGWHSDDNRAYLKQRDFADGDPATIVPSSGDVVTYTAERRNIHAVDEITDGERLTMALWFSRDAAHDEDAKLISLLSQTPLHNGPELLKSLPASSNMYWVSPKHASSYEFGVDICCARLHVLGYDVVYSEEKISCFNFSELSNQRLRLARGDELFDYEFVKILHALQVVQFCCWKASDLKFTEVENTIKVVPLLQSQREKSISLKDLHLAESVLSAESAKISNWAHLTVAVAVWRDYAQVT